MFKTVKEKVTIEQVVSHFTGEELKVIGSNLAMDDEVCPFCGHKDCFRVRPENDEEEGFFKCFSCDKAGDSIAFVQFFKELETPVEACKLIAKEFGFELPAQGNPMQEIFNLAARYYRTCYVDTCNKEYPELNGLTPNDYQLKVRGHLPKTMDHLQVGWSDGGLIEYLRGVGVDEDLLQTSGLVNKTGRDFLPSKVFIYPHLIRGRVSHFTFKDPLKKLAYQLKNSAKLNGHQWYNSDSIGTSDTVIVVEGENDLASIIDAGWGNVIASIGSLAGAQIEWLFKACEKKHVVTLFDPDDAGNKYREKMAKVRSKFLSLKQIVPADDKDIDDLLRSGSLLKDILGSATEIESSAGEEADETEEEAEEKVRESDLGIFVQNNSFYRIRYKDGEPVTSRLSDFNITLKNVFIKDNERTRDVILTRQDGKKSRPVPVTSDVKTSLKPFRTFAANVIDGTFTGSDADLSAVWEYVYATNKENEVHLIEHVGKNDAGWLFHDKMITNTGVVLEADPDGTFWQAGTEATGRTGIKAISISATKSFDESDLEIPSLRTDLTTEENEEFFGEFIMQLAANLADPGAALITLAWLRSTVYSNWFFRHNKHFPFLFFCGDKGGGKSTLMDWFLDIFNMSKCGHIQMPHVRSPVALERKLAYYASLPICIDELRNDKHCGEYWGHFRSWYDRRGREMGTNQDSTSVKHTPVRSCVMFGGQDMPSDGAVRERSIPITILNPKLSKRETVKSYDWIKRREHLLPSIGYHWIREYETADLNTLKLNMEESSTIFRTSGLSNRFSINYGMIKVMGDDMAKKYFPTFDWEGYLLATSASVEKETDEEDPLYKFFTTAESLTSGQNPKLSSEHYRIDGDTLYFWPKPFWLEVSKELRNSQTFVEGFSEFSFKKKLQEQSWCGKETVKKYIGIDGKQKHVLPIDLSTAPEYVKVFANYVSKKVDE